MSAIRSFVRREPVLFIAALAALLTCFFVPPDSRYLSYLDLVLSSAGNLFSSSPRWLPCSPVFSFRPTAGISPTSTFELCLCSTA